MDVPVIINGLTYRLYECCSADCSKLIAKQYQADNQMFYTQCKYDKFNTAQSERNKNLRGNAAFSLDSRTNLRYQQCVEEQVAKGRSDNAFLKSMLGVGDSGGTALPALTAP